MHATQGERVSKGDWSGAHWDAAAVKPGQLVLMPTFRFARLYRTEADGRRTFVAADGSCLLCEHGEKASTIATWCYEERAAQRDRIEPKKRSGICDCTTARGLFMKQAGLATDNEPLVMPASLFDHLVAIGAPSILVKGREARRLPYTSGERTTYLTSFGQLVCRHGRKRSTLTDRRRAAACSCTPVTFPNRSALIGVRIGRYAGAYGQKKRPRDDAEPIAEAIAEAIAEPTVGSVQLDAAQPADPTDSADPTDPTEPLS